MFLSYLNYQLNAYPGTPPRKPQKIIDLKTVFKSITMETFPYTYKNVRFDSVELCSNSKGCNPKKEGGKMDYLVAMKDTKNNIKTALYNDDEKAVLLNVRGKYKIGDTMCTLYLRIPKSAAIGVRLGMSEQIKIKMDGNADTQIDELRKELTKQIFEALKAVPNLRSSKLNGMAVHGLNLHNPLTGNRPPQRIQNFLEFLRALDREFDTHSLDYDKKNGKQVVRGNFKPDVHGIAPTIGITGWTMVDFVGGRSVAQTITLKNKLVEAFNKTSLLIKYTTDAKQPKTHGKATMREKGCPGNVPPANKEGNCPSDMYIPLPNKYKSLCCYKKKLSKTTAQDALKKYTEAQMKVPQTLQNRINALRLVPQKPKEISSVKRRKSAPGVVYIQTTGEYLYKDKRFDCMLLAKPYLEAIAILMKLNPKGFKKDLCSKILEKARNDTKEKYEKARLRLLKMKARYTNLKSEN
tara:strand:+ start:1593 stop:2987 length:1395 start_codon:yes stop_codon:yes gene_type:complete